MIAFGVNGIRHCFLFAFLFMFSWDACGEFCSQESVLPNPASTPTFIMLFILGIALLTSQCHSLGATAPPLQQLLSRSGQQGSVLLGPNLWKQNSIVMQSADRAF